MKAKDFLPEDKFGTNPKRPARAGSRPPRSKYNEQIHQLHIATGWNVDHLEMLKLDELADLHKKHVDQKVSEEFDSDNNPWRVTDVDPISETDFEVALKGPGGKQLNFVIRPVDFMETQLQRYQIDTMDVRDLQTGKTMHWGSMNDLGKWLPIFDAIDTHFWESPTLQAQLEKIIGYYMDAGEQGKNPNMMPGLDQRGPNGVAVSADDFIASHDKTQDALAKMKKVDEADRGFRGVGGARDREDDEHHHLDNHNSTEKKKFYKVKEDGKLYVKSVSPQNINAAYGDGWLPSKSLALAKGGQQGVAGDGRKQQFRGTGNAGMPRTDDDGNVLEQGVAEGRLELDRKTGQMRHDNSDSDQRHGLYINGKLVKTYGSREQAENVKKRDAKFKDATIKKIVESQEQFCADCGGSLAESGKASRALCVSGRPDSDLGASNLASCKSQGLRARDGNKSHKLGKSSKSRIKVGGHRIKGNKYGGPLPDWS